MVYRRGAGDWLIGRDYDRRSIPVREKSAALLGMGMTENQGGSDLRTNMTRAEPASGTGAGRFFRLTGHSYGLPAAEAHP